MTSYDHTWLLFMHFPWGSQKVLNCMCLCVENLILFPYLSYLNNMF